MTDWIRRIFLGPAADDTYSQGPESQESNRYAREVADERARRAGAIAGGSVRNAQLAPNPVEEQKILGIPAASNLGKLQNTAGLIYAMLDFDSADDPCHPLAM